MIISELMQYQMDFDWFVTSENGYLIHLTSNGAELPMIVKKSQEDLEFLHYYFNCKPIINVNQRFEKFGFESYALMAKRGLFSYERIDGEDYKYRLVYEPDNKLHFDELDEEIKILLQDLKLRISLSDQKTIDIGELFKT